MENKFVFLDITSIGINPMNPRKTFDPRALGELSESIKVVGVLQPITVRPIPTEEHGEKYQLVCGERRWRAAAMAGLKEIPAIIRELTDDEAVDVAITENLQRKDVSPLEEADAFKYLLDKGQSIADLCGRFGKSEFYVRGRMKLLAISDDFRKMLDAGEISISQAMEIAKFDADIQGKMYEQHFAQQCWNSWHDLNAKSLYQRVVQSYTKILDRYKFDKSECDTCPNCSKNFSLFAGGDGEVTCQNDSCLQRKKREYELGIALKLQKQHPEADFYTMHKDCPKKAELEKQGHEVKIWPGWPNRIGAVVTKELRSKVENGTARLAIWLYSDDPYFGYIEMNGACIQSEADSTIKDLQNKDKRNKELEEEKTVSEVRDTIKKMDIETLSAGELTAYESQLTLFILVRNLNKEQQEKLGTVQHYSMSDEEAWNTVMNVTPEQIAYIHRCNILNQVGDHFRRNFKTDLFFDWVNSRDKSIIPEVELKYREVYLRRKEKIDARIAEIELAKAEKGK